MKYARPAFPLFKTNIYIGRKNINVSCFFLKVVQASGGGNVQVVQASGGGNVQVVQGGRFTIRPVASQAFTNLQSLLK